RATFLGIGHIGWRAPLHLDGFVTDTELGELMALGAVGELGGWAFDEEGVVLDAATNRLVTTMALSAPPAGLRVGIAGGVEKAMAIRGALRGRLLSGLVTDEDAARLILERD